MIVGSAGIADSVGTDFEFVGSFGFAEMIDFEFVVGMLIRILIGKL